MNINHKFSVSLLMIVSLTGLSLSGCHTVKSGLNNFTGGSFQIANTPDSSSSRIQFLVQNGVFVAKPNDNSHDYGIIATTYKNKLIPKDDLNTVYNNNLGMTKPNQLELIANRYPILPSSEMRVIERYVTPNQPITLQYRTQSYNSSCGITGQFTPKANTDYRIIGSTKYNKCYMILEEAVRDSGNNIVFKTKKWDK